MSALSQLNIIQVKGLSKTVTTVEGDLTILSDISFNVKSGNSVAVVGTSGSGKSTLLSLLAGLDQSTQGSIHLDGLALHELDEEARAALRAEKVGFVFQSFMLVQSLLRLKMLCYPLSLRVVQMQKSKRLHYLKKWG